jgi:AcrR family transcriptional regulator
MGVNPASGEESRPYHHGRLREALLDAATRILDSEGVPALTLRRVAREAGVSHAAPKNHFGDLAGLLSAVAAAGFDRLREEMKAEADLCSSQEAKLHVAGRCYVLFAAAHPGLFRLMFRTERLHANSPALRSAADGLMSLLAEMTGGPSAAAGPTGEEQAVLMTLAWAQVHGLATLLLEGRLGAILNRLEPRPTEEAFVARLLAPPDVDQGAPLCPSPAQPPH